MGMVWLKSVAGSAAYLDTVAGSTGLNVEPRWGRRWGFQV